METQYTTFQTVLPANLEASGFKAPRYVLVQIADARLPIVAKRTERVASFLEGASNGTPVTIVGRVREVVAKNKMAGYPDLYMEMSDISTAGKAVTGGGSAKKPSGRWP